MSKNNKVIILRGPSGAGKSTYIKKLGASSICSADKFFENTRGEYVFDKNKLGDAHAACMKSFIYYLTYYNDSTVVVDNTNTSVEEVSPYMLVAAALGAEVEIHNIPYKHLTVEQLAARNKHGVGAGVIKNQIWKLEHARLPSYWKVVNVEIK
jgi:predicted kinase